MDVLNAGIKELLEKLDAWIIALIAALPNIAIAIFVLVGFYYLGRGAFSLMKRIFSRTQLNTNLENILASVAKWIVLLIGLMAAISVLGLDKTVLSMLAGVGVVGIALGFALKDIAANFIAGIMLAVRAPLRIRDRIRIKDIEGTVIDIRLRDTIVRMSDGVQAVIPNNTFTDNTMLNFNTFGKRKITVEVTLSYNNDPQQVKAALLNSVKKIDTRKSQTDPLVAAKSMDANGITYVVEMWISYPSEDMTERTDSLIVAVDDAVDLNRFQRPYFSGSTEFSKSLMALVQQPGGHDIAQNQ